MPEPMKARPRVVRTLRRARIRSPPSQRAVAGTGTWRSRSATTSAVVRRASWVSLDGHQPVGQHRRREHLHVVGDDVVATLEGGVGASGAQQVQRGAR